MVNGGSASAVARAHEGRTKTGNSSSLHLSVGSHAQSQMSLISRVSTKNARPETQVLLFRLLFRLVNYSPSCMQEMAVSGMQCKHHIMHYG
jgi:hypothetical protein